MKSRGHHGSRACAMHFSFREARENGCPKRRRSNIPPPMWWRAGVFAMKARRAREKTGTRLYIRDDVDHACAALVCRRWRSCSGPTRCPLSILARTERSSPASEAARYAQLLGAPSLIQSVIVWMSVVERHGAREHPRGIKMLQLPRTSSKRALLAASLAVTSLSPPHEETWWLVSVL